MMETLTIKLPRTDADIERIDRFVDDADSKGYDVRIGIDKKKGELIAQEVERVKDTNAAAA